MALAVAGDRTQGAPVALGLVPFGAHSFHVDPVPVLAAGRGRQFDVRVGTVLRAGCLSAAACCVGHL